MSILPLNLFKEQKEVLLHCWILQSVNMRKKRYARVKRDTEHSLKMLK